MIEITKYVELEKEKLKEEVSSLSKKPLLAIVQINQNDASNTYVKGKIKDLEEVGLLYKHYSFDIDTSEEKLLSFIEELNNDNDVTGIIVQLPLPKGISEEKIKRAISPLKDADGFNAYSKVDPATPKGILNYLKDNNFDFKGRNAVVLGRSNIVGKPMHDLLLKEDMNVTILHSKTSLEDREFYLAHADLIVSAVGKINTITSKDNLKKSAYLIDVGINRDENGKLIGDLERNLDVAFQSPVPKGVGLLTRLQLLKNLMELYR